MARCLYTGGQRRGCDGRDPEVHSCGAEIYDGFAPGAKECAAWCWVCLMHGELWPEVNRLVRESDWDRENARWRPRPGAERGTPDLQMEWYVKGSLVVKTSESSPFVTLSHSSGSLMLKRNQLWDLIQELTDVEAKWDADAGVYGVD